MTQLPSDPHDGQQVVFPNDEGVCIYTYDEATNSWSYQQYGEVGSAHVTYTDQVLVRENAASDEVGSALADPSELKTQKEVNWYLDEKFGQGGGGVEYLPLTGGDLTGNIRFDGGGSIGAIQGESAFISLHFEGGSARYNGFYSHDDDLVTKKRLADYATSSDLYKVEAKVGMGVWQFKREAGAARNGEFRMVTREGQPTETWTAVARFGLNERDRRNMLFDWSRLASGDEVLVTNKNNPSNYARFQIDPAQDGVMEVLRVEAQMGRAINGDDHDIEVVARDRGNYATKTSVEAVAFAMVNQIQSMESAQGTKSKGKWAHHGGPLPDTGIPAESQFWMADDEGDKTQEYCKAKEIRIHAVGISDQLRSNNVLGAAEVGDRLIIQDLIDLDGCEYEITSVEFHDPDGDNYEEAYAVYGVKADETFCRGGVTPAELVSVRIKSSIGGDYLPLSGGTVTGPTTFDCPTMVKWDKASSNSYPFSVWGGDKWAFRVGWDGAVKSFGEFTIDQPSGTAFRIKKDHIDKVKIEHGGRIFCAYDLSLDDDNRTVTTKGWVKEQIAAIPAPEGGGGVGFTEKYNGNKFYKQGNETTALSDGEVMFLQNGVTTTMLAAVTHVALPEAGIDWTKFTKMGTIEVRNGGTLCGHLQVISAKNNAGRNWLVKVKMLDIVSNELEPESGHPCYFWGMFTE